MWTSLQTEEQCRLVFKDILVVFKSDLISFCFNSCSPSLRVRCSSLVSLPDLLSHALTASLHSETHQTQASGLHSRLPRIQRTAEIKNIWWWRGLDLFSLFSFIWWPLKLIHRILPVVVFLSYLLILSKDTNSAPSSITNWSAFKEKKQNALNVRFVQG